MIQIHNPADCCGCHACASVCAHGAITMQSDTEGFLYPVVDKSACADCGLCEQVCPVIHQASPTQPLNVYVARNNNEVIRRQSSSGGIFTLLAEAVIREGGVVFGAKFGEEWNVVHASTETLDGLAAFRGSKYVQSAIGNTYKEARNLLRQGRKVLFSGTPCQIAGLRRYLRKDYDNLLAVDVICHGVPSPMVWQRYLDEMRMKGDITDISFRDKSNSWNRYDFRLRYTSPVTGANGSSCEKEFKQLFAENTYMRGFLADLFLRPSCHSCPAKGPKGVSDITLGDYWGVEHEHPDWDDDKGSSVVIVHTEKGTAFVSNIDMVHSLTKLEVVCKYNPALVSSYPQHRNRTRFFSTRGSISSHWIERMLQPTLWERLNSKWYMIKRKFRTQNDNK